MSSIIFWFVAVLCIIFLLRLVVKKYSEWTDPPVTTSTQPFRQSSGGRIYTIDYNNTNPTTTTITNQNRCYDDDSLYYNQPPPDYSADRYFHPTLSGNIQKEIIITSKNNLPTYEEVIKQLSETQQNNNNNTNRIDGSLPLPPLEDNNIRTTNSVT